MESGSGTAANPGILKKRPAISRSIERRPLASNVRPPNMEVPISTCAGMGRGPYLDPQECTYSFADSWKSHGRTRR